MQQIVVRRPRFSIGPEVSNHWMNGNVLETHFANAFHATIPAAERFLIRTLGRARSRLDPKLQQVVKAFMGQEGQHAAAHDSFSRILQARGYDAERINHVHERAYRWIEARFPVEVCLAMGSGGEHYTALMGDFYLSHPNELAGVAPEMRKLLLWHAAEEVEHKDVVFDALRSVNSSYLLRALGFFLATAFLWVSTITSVVSLIRQDPEATWPRVIREYWQGLKRFPIRQILIRELEYLRPGFHPSQRGDGSAAREFLNSMTAESHAGGGDYPSPAPPAP